MFEKYETLLPYEVSSRAVLYFILLTLLIKFVLDKFRKDPRFVKFAKKLPGPRTLPLVGNSFDFLYNMDGKMEMLRIYEEKYGSTYRLWFGKYLMVGMADLKDLEVLFLSSKMLSKPAFMEPARQFWGDNVFLAEAVLWRKIRKGLQPIFVKNELTADIPHISQIINKYVRQIEEHVNDNEFDIGDILHVLAFNVLVEVILKTNLEYVKEDCVSIAHTMHKADLVFTEQMFKPWLRNPVVDFLLYRKLKTHFKRETTNLFEKILNREATKPFSTNVSFMEQVRKIKEDLPMDEQYVKEETINIIAAGTLTTSTTLSFCILMLSMHPEIQDKLYEEINAYFENENREADVDDLDKFAYLDQVLKETERRFSLVPIIFRNIDEDASIGSLTFPSGTGIMIPVCTIHMNPKYYKDPEKFDPENFSLEAITKRPKLAFLPFSVGSRNCIGKVLAEFELKLTMIALMRRFKFSTKMRMQDIDLMPGFVIASRNGYKVSIEKRI